MTAQQRRNDFLDYFEDWKNRTGHPCLGYYNSTNNEFCGEENLNNEAITRGYVTASFFELDYTRIADVKKLHKWAWKNTRSIRHGNPSGVLSQYIDYLTEYPSGFSGSGASAGTSLTSRPVGTTKPSSGAITPMSFDYISENGMTLTSAQKELLRKIERTSCALEEFSSIRELRMAKGYRVVVSTYCSVRQDFGDFVKN